jgi:hypothetical protein
VNDVIQVPKIQKVLGINSVQTYIINSARGMVFLNERPQPRPDKCVTNTCVVSYLHRPPEAQLSD